jgi:hypothetical protein
MVMKLEAKISCKYCNKEFRKESTLAAHLCEPKRRWQQEKETGVQLGLRAYLRFYEMTQGSAKTKSYKDFVESAYYSAFVKYGQYLVQIRAINTIAFTEWLIKQNKKLDQWTKEAFYDEWLYEYLRKEHPNDALDRSFAEMQRWADDNNKPFNVIFKEGAQPKLCNMIVNGRISAWIIFNCDSGVEFLSGLNTKQIAIIFRFIDPEFWQQKFKNYVADVEFIKSVLREAQV